VKNAQTGVGPTNYSILVSDGPDLCPAQIGSVSTIISAQTQTIAINGSGFGTQAAYTGNSNYILFGDITGNWQAGHFGNSVTLAVSSWTDTQIVLTGFSGGYSPDGHCIRPGDQLTLQVWNALTGAGPAVYWMNAATEETDSCQTKITSVSAITAAQTQTIDIRGVGFGFQEGYTGDSNRIELTDVTGNWYSGQTGNTVTLIVNSWDDNLIELAGFSGTYGTKHCIQPGDHLYVSVWNAQTGSGPAVYPVVASGGTTTCP
jgi:hypothetical protein